MYEKIHMVRGVHLMSDLLLPQTTDFHCKKHITFLLLTPYESGIYY